MIEIYYTKDRCIDDLIKSLWKKELIDIDLKIEITRLKKLLTFLSAIFKSHLFEFRSNFIILIFPLSTAVCKQVTLFISGIFRLADSRRNFTKSKCFKFYILLII